MGAVLVHIDLDGDRPDPSSLAALAAGRAVASSWGATLYAALVVHDPSDHPPDSTGQVVSAATVPAVEAVRAELARAGADKIIVAVTDVPLAPLWAAIGAPWQGILDHLRPRLVLFGADAPSAIELGPRTAARIGAKLLMRARAVGLDMIELRDRDGGYVRVTDGGASVVMIGNARGDDRCDDDIDVIVLALPGGGDARIELAGTMPADVAQAHGAMVALGDDVAGDPEIVRHAQRLAALLGAPLVGGRAAASAGAIPPHAVVERVTPLAPELCVAIGSPNLDLAGATSLVRVGSNGKGVDGVLPGPVGASVQDLLRALEEP
ncbi:MAG: hypothetical protein KIT31_41475 [Deltaproteobacteria bacterium]|nr:hypothetical protein [Deltaproteobacteria bacterium]